MVVDVGYILCPRGWCQSSELIISKLDRSQGKHAQSRAHWPKPFLLYELEATLVADHANHKGKNKDLALRSSSGTLLVILLYPPFSITFYPVTGNVSV